MVKANLTLNQSNKIGPSNEFFILPWWRTLPCLFGPFHSDEYNFYIPHIPFLFAISSFHQPSRRSSYLLNQRDTISLDSMVLRMTSNFLFKLNQDLTTPPWEAKAKLRPSPTPSPSYEKSLNSLNLVKFLPTIRLEAILVNIRSI